MAASTRRAASASPTKSSNMAEDQISPIGLATPLPTISGAEPWIADRSEQDSREAAPFENGKPVLGHHPAVSEITVRAPVEVLIRETQPTHLLGDRVERRQRLGHDLAADAVPGNDSQMVLTHCPLHLHDSLTEALTCEQAVEPCWQVLQPLYDMRLERHSSIGESGFEL